MIPVSKKIIHDKFDGSASSEGDIALLVLQREATHHKEISGLVSLDRCPNANLSSIGWYRSTFSGPPASNLEAVQKMTAVSREECERLFGELPKGVVCTKSTKSPNITCKWNETKYLCVLLQFTSRQTGTLSQLEC